MNIYEPPDNYRDVALFKALIAIRQHLTPSPSPKERGVSLRSSRFFPKSSNNPFMFPRESYGTIMQKTAIVKRLTVSESYSSPQLDSFPFSFSSGEGGRRPDEAQEVGR